MLSLATDIRDMFAEQIEYRELLVQLARRDLLLRYKQAAMGFAWAVLMPLANTIIFSVIFTRVARVETNVPYPVFAYCGLLWWNFSASTWKAAVTSLSSNATLVTKVYFPREVLPFAGLVVSLADLAIGSLLLVALMLYYRIGVSWPILLVPAILIVQCVFTAAIALLLAMSNLFFRDVKYVFEIGLMVWMLATSVVYPVERVGGRLGRLLQMNPMTPMIDAYRAVILRGELPVAGPLVLAFVVSVALLLASWVAFHRAELRFAENV